MENTKRPAYVIGNEKTVGLKATRARKSKDGRIFMLLLNKNGDD